MNQILPYVFDLCQLLLHSAASSKLFIDVTPRFRCEDSFLNDVFLSVENGLFMSETATHKLFDRMTENCRAMLTTFEKTKKSSFSSAVVRSFLRWTCSALQLGIYASGTAFRQRRERASRTVGSSERVGTRIPCPTPQHGMTEAPSQLAAVLRVAIALKRNARWRLIFVEIMSNINDR